jgi:hypothetical protein
MFLRQLRRPLDVSEEKGHRSSWWVDCHILDEVSWFFKRAGGQHDNPLGAKERLPDGEQRDPSLSS